MNKIEQIWCRAAWRLCVGLWLAATLGSLAEAAPASATATGPRKPSILFILTDDLGYGDLGCYGQTKIKTPNIDKLAQEGLRFTSFYAGSTVCAPSRCALMTGLNTGHGLIRGNANLPLRTEDRTVADVLKEAGYATGLVGKWGLGDEHTTGVPQKHGFEQFVGFLNQTHAHDYYPDYLWRYDPENNYDDKEVLVENQDGRKALYVQDFFTTCAINYLRIHKSDRFNRFKPFFLYQRHGFCQDFCKVFIYLILI